MNFSFTKMHGLGNDFVIIDSINQQITLSRAQIKQIADRHFGIGCDQILVLEPHTHTGVDFAYKIFNADGTEAEQCGNGARCIAKYLHNKQLTTKDKLVVIGGLSKSSLHLQANGMVLVNMGTPSTKPVMMQLPLPTAETLDIGVIAIGNPHAIIRVDDITQAKVDLYGPLIAKHQQFPKGINANFVEIVNRSLIKLRVYERGAGETLACGSGACATTAMGQTWGLLDQTVTVELTGGNLVVTREHPTAPIMMSGPAEKIFDGIFSL